MVFIFVMWAWSGWISLLIHLCWFIILVTVIVTITIIFLKGTHVHHWFQGAIIMTFCGHQNFLMTFIHAVATGVFVEGVARWGMDPNWKITRVESRIK